MPKKGPVQRISFGHILSPKYDGNGIGYINEIGKRPKGAKGGLRVVGAREDPAYEQLRAAVPELEARAMPLQEGPYAGEGERIDALVDEVKSDAGSNQLNSILDSLLDKTRPFLGMEGERQFPRYYDPSMFNFRFDADFTTTNQSVPTVGSILEDDGRIVYITATGSNGITLGHPAEQYMLAIGVLRRLGHKAYFSCGIADNGEGEEGLPLLAVADLEKEVPLVVSPMIRAHMPIGSVEIVSDSAMLGVTYTMRAYESAKQLGSDLVLQALRGHPLEQEDIRNQIQRIGEDLANAYRLWEGTEWTGQHAFVSNAIQRLGMEVCQADSWIKLRVLLSEIEVQAEGTSYDFFLATRGRDKEAPNLPINPDHFPLFITHHPAFLEIYPGLAEAVVNIWQLANEAAGNCVAGAKMYLQSKLSQE